MIVKREIKIVTITAIAAILTFGFLVQCTAEAAGIVATYTAPDGFQVVSYASAWADTGKLKGVYDELLRNRHGEEFKLLGRINIYPGPDPEGKSSAGKYYAQWKMEKGRPVLTGNRYINIYNGNEFTTVDSIARTLAHEYGHHFTYYYFFKNEKKLWDNWRNSGLAEARGLKNNPRVSAAASDHKWLIQEIAAEDYVQLFGSPTVKKSYRFKDIAERLQEGDVRVDYSTEIYNYRPQENYELPLAANLPGLKDYWLEASDLDDTAGSPPSQVRLRLDKVNQLRDRSTPQYVLTWDKSADDKTANLEYTLVWFEKTPGNDSRIYPVKTVTDGEPLTAVIGAAGNSHILMWEEVPSGVGYFVVYIKDEDGLITSSQVLAVDFGVSLSPATVNIDDRSLLNGVWFPPRVKVNERQMTFDVPPVVLNGRMMVPLRAVFEELGAVVDWEEQNQKITVNKGETEINLWVGDREAVVNGSHFTLDSPPLIKNGRTLVPVRFISEALGAYVGWNEKLQLATVEANKHLK